MNPAACWQTNTVDGVARLTAIECVVQSILGLALRIAGLGVLLMLVIGGFQFLTSGGNPEKTKQATNTLTYAIYGLVLIIISWLVLLLIESLTGIKVTEFHILIPNTEGTTQPGIEV